MYLCKFVMYPVQRREGGACGNEERVEEMSSVVGLDDGGDDDEEQELLLLLVGAIVRKVAESREPNQGNGEREAGREGANPKLLLLFPFP